MKYIFQIPIFLLMLWASGVSYATHSVALIDGKIDAYVKNACSDGSATGAIDLEIIGGTGPYEVTYKDAAGVVVHHASVDGSAGPGFTGDEDLDGQSPGIYTVIVIDGTCAVAEMEVEIGVNEPIKSINSIITNPCSSITKDGKIDISILGGKGPYKVKWFRFQKIVTFPPLPFLLKESIITSSSENGEEDLLNIGQGIFLLTIQEGECEILSYSFILEGDLNIKPQNDLFVCDNNKLSITPELEGGEAPFTYKWSDGQTTPIATNVGIGNITLEVTDNKNCVVKRSYEVKQSKIQYYISGKDKICNENEKGNIRINDIKGGKSPYTLLWSNGQTGVDVTNLNSGTYTVTITDAASCSISVSKTININVRQFSSQVTNSQTCKCTGNISLIFTGSELITGKWFKENQSISLSKKSLDHSISGICAGTYTFDGEFDGCKISHTFNVGETGCDHEIELVELVHSCSCGSLERCNGSIIVKTNLSGGFFNWYKNNNLIGNGDKVTDLCSGSYTVIYRHPSINGLLQKTINIDIISCGNTIADEISLAGYQNAIDCHTSDGFIELKSTNNNLAFLWSTGATSQSIDNLAEGDYIVTITDDCQNVLTKTYNICSCGPCIEEDPYNPYYQSYYPATCEGKETLFEVIDCSTNTSNDGSIESIIIGSGSELVFNWTGPNGFKANTPNITNLAVGEYFLQINDGCFSFSRKFIINSKETCDLNPLVIKETIDCYYESISYWKDYKLTNNGAIGLQISGGYPPYTIKWNTGATTSSIIVPRAGDYFVTITDSKGCFKTQGYQIEPNKYYDYPDNLQILEIFEFKPSTYMYCTGDGPSGAVVTVRLIGGTSKAKVAWYANGKFSHIQEVNLWQEDPKGVKVGQATTVFSGLDPDKIFSWGATAFNTCGCENYSEDASFSDCSYDVTGGVMACNDHNGEPCVDPKIEISGDGCFNWTFWDDFWNSWPTITIKIPDSNPKKKYYVELYRRQFQPNNNFYGAFLDSGTQLDFKMREPGTLNFVIYELDDNNRDNGCIFYKTFKYIDGDKCHEVELDLEVGPQPSDCPTIASISATDDSGVVTLEIEMDGVAEDGDDVVVTIRSKDGAPYYSEELNISNGDNEISFDKTNLDINISDYIVTILSKKAPSCTIEDKFSIGTESCPTSFMLSYNKADGYITFTIVSNFEGEAILTLPNNSLVTIDVKKGRTTEKIFVGALTPGTHIFTLDFCDTNLSKSILVPNSCPDDIILSVNQEQELLRIKTNFAVDMGSASLKISRDGIVKAKATLNLVKGNKEYDLDNTYKSLSAGEYVLEIFTTGCPPIIKKFKKESACKVSYYNKTHGQNSDGLTVKCEFKKPTDLQVDGIYNLYKIVNGESTFINQKTFKLASGIQSSDLYIGPFKDLTYGSYEIVLSHDQNLNCPSWRYKFNKSGIKDDDPPAANMTCKDLVFDIEFDPISGDFIFLSRPVSSDELIVGYNFVAEVGHPAFENYSTIVDDIQNVKGIEIDVNKNHIISNVDENGKLKVSKFSITSNKIWSQTLDGKKFISQHLSQNGNIKLLVFDQLISKFQIVTINQNGIVNINDFNIPLIAYNQLKVLENGIVAARYENNSLKLEFFNNNGSKKEISLDKKLKIKDIENINSTDFLLGADFNGELNINGKKYQSIGFNNICVIKMNSNLDILKVFSENNSRDEFISHVSDGRNGTIAVSGNFISNPSINIPDSCLFVKVITLEDPCTTFTSTLTHDTRTCQLTWDTPPSGYTTTLQYQINGVWVDVSVAFGMDVVSSPFTVAKDGSFRLISKKQGCPDVVSNIITTACLNSCVCPVPSIIYDQTACTLTWSITECTGYTVSLQRLSSANVWETIVQQATSPYYITTNGSYRLSLSKGSQAVGGTCATVVSATATTACTPSSNPCVCTSPSLIHNEGTCTLSWAISGCSGFTSVLQRNVAGTWMTTNASSPYTIPANSNGQYRILSSKPGCTDVLSNVINVTCSCSSPASITIFDYGTSGLGQNATILKGQFYTHEVSQGYPDACDDSFIQLAFGSSVVNSSWTFYVNGSVAVMPGTVIGSQYVVDLYLPTPPSGGTADVFMQSPCGDFYQLHLVYDCESGCPEVTNIITNHTNNCHTLEISSLIERQISITYSYHGLDDQERVITHTVTVLYQIITGTNLIEYCALGYEDIGWYDQITYQIDCNNCAECNLEGLLVLWLRPIVKDKQNHQADAILENLEKRTINSNQVLRFYPNPFSKGINLELTSDVAETLRLEVFNNLGLQVFKKSLDLQQGINLRYIEEFENVPAGVYTVKVKSLTKDYTTRVIKVD